MKKKYIKIFAFALFSFFMSSVSVFAREMTVEELGEEAQKLHKDAGYVYILGEYAFTSNYKITQEALILAATSAHYDNPTDLSQVVIYQIEGIRNDDYETIGWKKGPDVLGTKEMPDKVDVKWIDMQRVLEKSNATISLDINGKDNYSTYTKILQDKLKFEFEEVYGDSKLTYADGKVSGLLLKNTKISLSNDDKVKFKDPKYFFAYVLEIPGANANTKITTSGMGRKGEIEFDKFDVQNGKTPGIVVLVPVNPDDWKSDPTYTITVDLDGDKTLDDEYGATEYKLDLSELRFQQESKMELTTDNLPKADVDSISTNWGYTRSLQDTYELKNVEGTNKYKLTGTIVEQKINNDVFPKDEATGFYFLLSVGQNIDENLYRKATVTYPGNKSTKTSTITDETGVTILFSTSDAKKGNPITITVDLDGAGNEYYPVDYEIDLSELLLEKSSKFSVQSVDKVEDNPLKSEYGWKQPENYSVKFDTVGTTVKVTGLLPILDTFDEGKNPFEGDDATGYYLPFVIKTEAGNKNDNQKLTVQFIHKGEAPKTLTAANFDGADELYILRHLDKDAEDRTFKIIVDMDGDGTEYAPYEITFDWNELKLQERTNASLKLSNASESDKKQLEEFGYDSKYNNLGPKEEGNPIKLTGTMKEQVVNSEAFGKDNINGYYFDFTFEIPDGVDRNKVTISRLNGDNLNSGSKKDFETSEWTEDGKLTILFRFPEAPNCKEGNNCKLYYKVDFDGDENEYLPTLYTIDYSGVTFKKSSLVNLDPVTSGTISGDSEKWNGFTESENYKVEFEEESSTFKVTGLITIFDDKGWTGGNPFKDAYEHYLAFKLSKAEVKGTDSETVVKFLTDGNGHGEENAISKEDFQGNNSIYVLKYLNPKTDYNNKKFTITIDFDDEEEEYEPYTITIDWSELDFQYESPVATTVVVDPKAESSAQNLGYISEENINEIEKWGYDFDNIGEVSLKSKGLDGYELTGTVKEQNVAGAGFKTPEGYYVPIKIYGPSIQDAYGDHFLSQPGGRNKWTIYLRDEDGKYKKEIKPSEEDYENGYIVVLFKLKNDDTKTITYKVDWDGSGSNVFLEKEITISYDGLNYQALNTITYKYKDAEGNDQTESTKVYQNEKATLKDITNIDSDYRKFDGWYKSDNSKVNESTLTIDEDKDETLTAHWKLDADAFVKAVIDDLNGKEEVTDKFNLTMDEVSNTITIDVEDSRILLSEMNNTNIPGAIAYLLQKGEITGITLSTGDKKVEFTKEGANNEVSTVSLDEDGSALKNTIKAGAKALFQEVLEDESTYTLSKMALTDTNFTLTISSNDDTVTFVDDDKKDYTFNFETEAITVNNEVELKTALTKNEITHIFLGNDIEVTSQHEIKRPVVINGEKYNEEGNYKISVKEENKDEVDSIFKVSSSGVTIDSIELSNTKMAIIVEGDSAELTTTGLTLTNIEEAGIEVAKGKLTAKEVTFEGESHDVPTAKYKKENKRKVSVNIEKATENEPKYINVKQHHNDSEVKDDTYESTSDTYYYLDAENIKNYVLVGFMGRSKKMWLYRLYEEGERIGDFNQFYGKETITSGDKTLYFVGYGSVNRGSDFNNGAYYNDLIFDIAEEIAGSRGWHFANFAEREDSKYVTLDDSLNSLEGYESNIKFYAYKFQDKTEGLTIGDLKKLDSKFAKMWDALNKKAEESYKAIKDEKDQDVDDNTVINSELKLKLGSPTVVKP